MPVTYATLLSDMMSLCVWILIVAVITFSVYAARWLYRYRKSFGRCCCTTQLHGKTVIITGATAGLGKRTAFNLAERGARIILACRNVNKAYWVAEEIITRTGNKEVFVRHLDVSDLTSVRKFTANFVAEETALHMLINNAGVGSLERQKSPQGFEMTMATNHFGPFLLTNLLLGLLKESAPSRVITLSSVAHLRCKKLPLDDLNGYNEPYSGWCAYTRSKLCNILFNRHLSELLKGTGVTANCLHPGVVNTDIFGKVNSWYFGLFISPLVSFFGKTCEEGVQTTLHLALSKELENVSGKYFADCKETKCSRLARDAELARRLWDVTEKIVSRKEEI